MSFNFKIKFYALILLITLELGCQSSKLKSFDNLYLGQEKDDVIDAIGNPTLSEKPIDEHVCFA